MLSSRSSDGTPPLGEPALGATSADRVWGFPSLGSRYVAGSDAFAMVGRLSTSGQPVLSASEAAHVSTLRSTRRVRRFLAGRAVLQRLLADLALPHKTGRQTDGKPTAGGDLNVSLSYCNDLVVACVALSGSVGVDIESVRRAAKLNRIVGPYPIDFGTTHLHLRKAVAWTRCEAQAKATGERLSRVITQTAPAVDEQWGVSTRLLNLHELHVISIVVVPGEVK